MKWESRGLPLCDYVAPGDVRHLVYRAQAPFAHVQLEIPTFIAESFEIRAFLVGKNCIPLEWRGENLVDLAGAGIVHPTRDMECVVANKTKTGLIFYAEIWGRMEIEAPEWPVMKGAR